MAEIMAFRETPSERARGALYGSKFECLVSLFFLQRSQNYTNPLLFSGGLLDWIARRILIPCYSTQPLVHRLGIILLLIHSNMPLASKRIREQHHFLRDGSCMVAVCQHKACRTASVLAKRTCSPYFSTDVIQSATIKILKTPCG